MSASLSTVLPPVEMVPPRTGESKKFVEARGEGLYLIVDAEDYEASVSFFQKPPYTEGLDAVVAFFACDQEAGLARTKRSLGTVNPDMSEGFYKICVQFLRMVGRLPGMLVLLEDSDRLFGSMVLLVQLEDSRNVNAVFVDTPPLTIDKNAAMGAALSVLRLESSNVSLENVYARSPFLSASVGQGHGFGSEFLAKGFRSGWKFEIKTADGLSMGALLKHTREGTFCIMYGRRERDHPYVQLCLDVSRIDLSSFVEVFMPEKLPCTCKAWLKDNHRIFGFINSKYECPEDLGTLRTRVTALVGIVIAQSDDQA